MDGLYSVPDDLPRHFSFSRPLVFQKYRFFEFYGRFPASFRFNHAKVMPSVFTRHFEHIAGLA